MPGMRSFLALAPVLLAGCNQTIGLGKGSPNDARLVADLYTWTCDGGDEEDYEGVFSYSVSLEYAPDGLPDRDLPSSGCASGIDLFPSDAGGGAADLPDAADPQWDNDDDGGPLERVSTGFYTDDVFQNQHRCDSAQDLLGDGTVLSDAGAFSGVNTPRPEEYTGVSVEGLDDGEYGLTFGDEFDVSWNADGWDATWLQVRRETGGVLQEAVTCNATGEESFHVDEDVWSQFDGVLAADVTNLYLGVQRSRVTEVDDGQKIETLTRVMHALVVDE
jgi:hypothetical protein